MQQLFVAVLIAVLINTATYGQEHTSTNVTSIEQVDFRNFTFSLPWCSKTFNGDVPSKVTLKDGHFKRGGAYVSVDRKDILYADLTEDGVEEAVVPVRCGPLRANYAGSDEVLIFTLQNAKPELLAELDEDVFNRDYERFYKSSYLSAESRVRVAHNTLIIDKTSGECHACSDTYRNIAFQYQWNSRGFSLVGKPTITKSK